MGDMYVNVTVILNLIPKPKLSIKPTKHKSYDFMVVCPLAIKIQKHKFSLVIFMS
jgi:hypothetical protein